MRAVQRVRLSASLCRTQYGSNGDVGLDTALHSRARGQRRGLQSARVRYIACSPAVVLYAWRSTLPAELAESLHRKDHAYPPGVLRPSWPSSIFQSRGSTLRKPKPAQRPIRGDKITTESRHSAWVLIRNASVGRRVLARSTRELPISPLFAVAPNLFRFRSCKGALP